ncbi:MAG: transcription antitermination factor NusB [Bacteroidetes bacterium]|nr:transcription antitermination factor NusB [Bacteroidota bacterium]
MENRNVRRRIIREKVMQALYAFEIAKDPPEHVIKHVLVGLEKNKDAHAFAKQLVIATITHATDIDKVIRSKVANWDFKRIALIDRLILRMAICELLYFKDIPPKVSMNEAIELAKLFSTEKSGQFVNGILDAVLEDLRTKGGYTKAGRGLFEGAGPRANRSKPEKTT